MPVYPGARRVVAHSYITQRLSTFPCRASKSHDSLPANSLKRSVDLFRAFPIPLTGCQSQFPRNIS